MVLPNYVPAWYCDLAPDPPQEPGIRVGWTGSLLTHPDDLDATSGAVQPVLDRHLAANPWFHVVGTGKGVRTALGLTDEPSSTGWLPLEEYPGAMAEIDVGIVPLAGHRFNEAKSWLKGLEFAALGVPFVATPTTEYRELHDTYRLGYLASDRDEWEALLDHLVANPAARMHAGEQGRATVREHLTVEKNAYRWMEAWALALEHSKRRTDRDVGVRP